MFHVRSIDRIGNETHRISEFLKNIIQKLSYIRTAFRVRWRKEVQLYIPPRALSILEIQLRICAQRIRMPATHSLATQNTHFSNLMYK